MYTVHYSKSDICKERKNIYISRKLQFPASLVFFVKIYTKSLRLWYIYWEINKPASVFFFFLKLNFLLWYILQQEWQNEEWVPPKFIPKLLLLMQVKKWRDPQNPIQTLIQACRLADQANESLLLNRTRSHAFNIGRESCQGDPPWKNHLVPLLISTRAPFPQPWPGICGGLRVGEGLLASETTL